MRDIHYLRYWQGKSHRETKTEREYINFYTKIYMHLYNCKRISITLPSSRNLDGMARGTDLIERLVPTIVPKLATVVAIQYGECGRTGLQIRCDPIKR